MLEKQPIQVNTIVSANDMENTDRVDKWNLFLAWKRQTWIYQFLADNG